MEIIEEKVPELQTRRGVKLHTVNPFIPTAASNTKSGVKKITSSKGDKMMMVSENTGEIVAQGAGFWHTQEVDKTQFVKLYINGVKALKELTQAGTKLFAVLYDQVQIQIGIDKIQLSYASIDQKVHPISKPTYSRGMKELIEKGFLAATPVQGVWYINPDFMWNGDRLAFVKEIRLAKPKRKAEEIDSKTIDMFESLPIEFSGD